MGRLFISQPPLGAYVRENYWEWFDSGVGEFLKKRRITGRTIEWREVVMGGGEKYEAVKWYRGPSVTGLRPKDEGR